MTDEATRARDEPTHFIQDIIEQDLAGGKHNAVVTRFPPEPNGYLHIGHAKSIVLNYSLAKDFSGRFHLRFDDTNPTTEDAEFVDSIQRDIRWLGVDWGDNLFHASDYFERLYRFAEQLINQEQAYVDSLSDEDVRAYRGTVTEAGKPSPHRDRSVAENLDLFRRMRAGEFQDGEHVLRAKIDMASPNMKMRDPLIYRIRRHHHYRTGDEWCIYPLYDFAHCLSDYIEGITHSICTLEFENNRELYDWILDALVKGERPHQYEFARLAMTHTIMSKRNLLELVRDGHVSGWDDPRMPTLSGYRRRGYTPEAIRRFCEAIGVAKNNSTVEVALLEHTLRDDLNRRARRVMAVLDPLPVVIENYPQDKQEELDAAYFPADIGKEGSRRLPFSANLLIERADFAEHPPKGFHRLTVGGRVRLRHGYVIRCDGVERDDAGNIAKLRCSHEPDTLDAAPKGPRVKGTIHWVCAKTAVEVEVRLFDRLFKDEFPGAGDADFKDSLNPNSLTVGRAHVELSLKSAAVGDLFQFERTGFFRVDEDTQGDGLVFNRTVPLKDSWAKQSKQDLAPPKRERSKPGAVASTPALLLDADAQALVDTHALDPSQAKVLAENPRLLATFNDALSSGQPAQALSAIIANDIRSAAKGIDGDLPISGQGVARVVELTSSGKISSSAAKRLIKAMVGGEGDPDAIIKARGLAKMGDDELSSVVAAALAQNAEVVERYRAGEKNLFGVLMGAAMREAAGRADAGAVKKVLSEALG